MDSAGTPTEVCWGYGTYADAALKLLGRQCRIHGLPPGHATRELVQKANPKPNTIDNWWDSM